LIAVAHFKKFSLENTFDWASIEKLVYIIVGRIIPDLCYNHIQRMIRAEDRILE
jgi:hypothetical protein